MSEAELIRKCQKNNKQAQRILFETNYNLLMHLSMRYAKNADQAKQLLFDGYGKLLDQIEEFPKNGNGFDKWMKEHFISNAVEFLKDQKHEYFITTTVHLKEVKPHATYNPEERQEEAIRLDGGDVLNAIQELPPSFRAMFNMCVIDEFDIETASGILEVTPEMGKINLEKATYLFHQNLNKNRNLYYA